MTVMGLAYGHQRATLVVSLQDMVTNNTSFFCTVKFEVVFVHVTVLQCFTKLHNNNPLVLLLTVGI